MNPEHHHNVQKINFQDPSVFLTPLSTPYNTPTSSTCSLDVIDKTVHSEIEQLINSSLNRYVSKHYDIQNWLRVSFHSVEEELHTNTNDSDPSSFATSSVSFGNLECNDSPSRELKYYIDRNLDQLASKTYNICTHPEIIDITLKSESVRLASSSSLTSSLRTVEAIQPDIEDCICNSLDQLKVSDNSYQQTVDISLKSESIRLGSPISSDSNWKVKAIQPHICNSLNQLKASENNINEKSICIHSGGFDVSPFLMEMSDDKPSSDEELEAFINSSFKQLKSRLSDIIEHHQPFEFVSDQIDVFTKPITLEMHKINWQDLSDEMKQRIFDALRKLEISIDGVTEELKIDVTSSIIFNKTAINREADFDDSKIRELSDDEKIRIIESATDQLDKHIDELMDQLHISVHPIP